MNDLWINKWVAEWNIELIHKPKLLASLGEIPAGADYEAFINAVLNVDLRQIGITGRILNVKDAVTSADTVVMVTSIHDVSKPKGEPIDGELDSLLFITITDGSSTSNALVDHRSYRGLPGSKLRILKGTEFDSGIYILKQHNIIDMKGSEEDLIQEYHQSIAVKMRRMNKKTSSLSPPQFIKWEERKKNISVLKGLEDRLNHISVLTATQSDSPLPKERRKVDTEATDEFKRLDNRMEESKVNRIDLSKIKKGETQLRGRGRGRGKRSEREDTEFVVDRNKGFKVFIPGFTD
eukprot:GHVH01005329.1.p3 GENE.GHVH01005329.1~~GHVH01005329.1.p3  ORF type:complete len:293 (+),score=60.13 GHVH01005329.1:3075-3953(+)